MLHKYKLTELCTLNFDQKTDIWVFESLNLTVQVYSFILERVFFFVMSNTLPEFDSLLTGP